MIAAGCAKHKRGAVACPICLRIRVEADIVTRTVDALLAAGYLLNVENGGETRELPAFTNDRAAVLGVLMETDDDWLLAKMPHAAIKVSFVRFVYGNDGWDVINDYGVSLEPVLKPVIEHADVLSGARS